MNDFILRQALAFLTAKDVLAAGRASRKWQQALSFDSAETKELWKQVCKNESPHVSNSMMKKIQDNGINYHLFAKGLGQSLPSPGVSLDDVFAVVEFYREVMNDGARVKVSEGLSLCPLPSNGIRMQGNDMKVIIRGRNPYSVENVDTAESRAWQSLQDDRRSVHETSPLAFAAKDALGMIWKKHGHWNPSLKIKVSLLRRDKNRAVCILNQAIDEMVDDHFLFPWGYGLSFIQNFVSKDMLSIYVNERHQKSTPLETSVAGLAAKLRLHELDGNTKLVPKGELKLHAVLPQRGSNEEPAWLHFMRQDTQNFQRYRPSQEDLAVLSDIPHFEFELVMSNLRFSIGDKKLMNLPGDSLNVVLDGLCWE